MQQILNYINSKPRNKIVIHKYEVIGIHTIDIGLDLSKLIESFSTDKNFSLKVQSILDNLLNSSVTNHNEFGKYISINNLGILFEPELKINFNTLLDQHSKDICLFVKWDGDISNDKLYFLTNKDGIEININNLSHIVV